MTMEEARGIAARAWCHPLTSATVMDTVLCEVFAGILHDNLALAHADQVAMQQGLEAVVNALNAQITMRDTAKPRKLVDALSWRENDEYAAKLADEALKQAEALLANPRPASSLLAGEGKVDE